MIDHQHVWVDWTTHVIEACSICGEKRYAAEFIERHPEYAGETPSG